MNDNPENRNQAGSIGKPSEEALLRFAERLLENQVAQIGLQKQDLTEGYKYSTELLTAQTKGRQNEREHRRELQRERMIFAGIIVLLLTVFVRYALYLNKDQVALEIIKVIALIAAGGMGGYALGRYRPRQPKNGD
jgi:hypothetical protein